MSIIYLFCIGKDWNSIEETARNVMDKRWLSNQKQKIKKFNEPHGHNFEAVAHFKQYADQRDPFYIYTMNERRGNPNKPSYVFKSSKLKAQFTLNMDYTSSENKLSEELFRRKGETMSWIDFFNWQCLPPNP